MKQPFLTASLCAFVALLASVSWAEITSKEGVAELKAQAQSHFRGGNAYEGALTIVNGIPAVPNDAQYARDMLELGQMFKFAYDNLLTVAQDREILEKYLVKTDNPRLKTLWLLCFPSYDALNPEQLEAAFTTYGQIVESQDLLARMACYGISVSVYREMGSDSLMVQALNDLGALDRWRDLTREALFSAIAGLYKNPDRMQKFLDSSDWSGDNRQVLAKSSFVRAIRNAATSWKSGNKDVWAEELVKALTEEQPGIDRYYLISVLGQNTSVVGVRNAIRNIAFERGNGPDVIRARILALGIAINEQDMEQSKKLTEMLGTTDSFPFISDRKLEAEAWAQIKKAVSFLTENGQAVAARASIDRISSRYPGSVLAVRCATICEPK